ncbi:MJ0042-type zinc finger domain-containing protein, partial [Marinobacter adhaerens]|uniref:MJ0042-type zinc finger domain-containing protein n=1 Tax=Marinobacter adhaerens TaxID=1033846 RepID=UPI003C62AADA
MTQRSLQTQCPNCQTRFRVTEEQLGIAKGKVRCGNCMKVFNAIEHQVIPGGGEKPRTPSAPAQPAGASSPAGSTSGSGVSEEDFVF